MEAHHRVLVAYWRCGGSAELWWLIGDVVAQQRFGGLLVMWHGSVEIWWLIGDVEALWRFVGLFEMWWFIIIYGKFPNFTRIILLQLIN